MKEEVLRIRSWANPKVWMVYFRVGRHYIMEWQFES